MVKNNTNLPSTSKFRNLDHVIVDDSQNDSDDDGEVESGNTTIPKVVVYQVYEESETFEKVMKEKPPHYLESNSVVYPYFKCIDSLVFTNQVFVTTENGEKVNPEINKVVVEDNKEATKEGFFSNQSIVENNLNKNSLAFQRSQQKECLGG